LGENRLLWKVKVGREQTAVEREVWERTDCCGKGTLGENRLLWKVKVGREQTAVESEDGKQVSMMTMSPFRNSGPKPVLLPVSTASRSFPSPSVSTFSSSFIPLLRI
jgi:hypothetical protein